jgi:hypothetical protein
VAHQKYQRIILHAGLHKTGTSSIQDNCYRHRDLLLQQGIFYPTFSFQERATIINHSDPLTGVFGSAMGRYGMPKRLNIRGRAKEAQQAFEPQFKEVLERPRADTLLLSAELVCDYIDKDLQKLRSRLQKYTREFQVIAFVRSPQSSLESILQQRNLAGNVVDPHSLVGVVTERYNRLQRAFGDVLKVYNFHEAAAHPAGLVGFFFSSLGLSLEQFGELDFSRANQRISLEAHRLIEEINRAYPAVGSADREVTREHLDTRALHTLPGQPFRLEAINDSGLSQALSSETEQLERQLGFKFPASTPGAAEPLWQMPTLLALEEHASRLDSKLFREVIAQVLTAEADTLGNADPPTASILSFIAGRIIALEDPPVPVLLDQLGADYFKFSALQVERGSPEMALQLMSLARHLRPEAEFINERISHYRGKLDKQ